MKYLGIDFGLKKIGLAVSEGILASPWQIIEVNNFTQAIDKISQIIEEGNFEKIVVGLSEGKIGQTILGFVHALQKKGFEVETVPETLSTKKAVQVMIQQGIRQKKRRLEDAYSAAEILQSYLDQQ